ncbi:oligosaccharide flippase family protein [Microvirga sp. STR05]|uniref:Oligosaccharide flippase family protein n=1 Tax=Hymenobacter duratus TaxID=2771356 RepID=A0ABR8JK19_9BACT|nr:oligosaccharide flippase family protein [Hymenobacter duratus]MBD2715720.1 oligosaccharide flippase family protein [Hymenobacter duratus]MBR7950631.1 oligosaccharide flippase family protein [Microvirga sp. STR05]
MKQHLQQLLRPLLRKGSFAQNFAVTLSGSAAVTAIGFLLTPVMSRIYLPAAYGQFAVFNSLASNLSMIATLTYTAAFLQPKTQEKFISLVQLTVVLSFGTCLLLAGGLLVGGPAILHYLKVEALGNWFYTLPVILLLFNLNNIMSGWYMRDKQFVKRTTVDLTTAIAGRGFTIGYGLLVGGNVVGLLLGEMFNRLTSTVSLMAGSLRHSFGMLWRTFSWQRVKDVAVEYREFPFYFLPASFISVLSTQLPIFALTTGFGSTSVGLYSFSVGLLEIPINLIGSAILPVFWQKATETYNNEPERLPTITLSLYYKLLYLGLIPFGVITVYGDVLFKFVFGARWEMAGVYTGYLGYYYVFKLMSQATSPIYTVMNKQRYILYSNIFLLVARGLGLGIGLYYHDLNLALLLFGLGSLLATFLIDLQVLALLKLPVLRIALRTILIVGATLLLLKGSRLVLEQLLS